MPGLNEGAVLAERYTLISRLGRGGMAEVWLAEDGASGERVALKILAAELAGRAGMRRLFAAEAAQAARLDHPGIVPIRAVHGDAQPAFFVMEYLPGGDLGSASIRDEVQLAGLLAPLAEALAHAHAAGVVHRDLKPSNVLLDAAGAPRLADFGIAAALEGEDPGPARRGGGTAPYASPEQLAGQPPSVADDAWGLGQLARQLLPDTDRRGELDALASRLTANDPAARPADFLAVRDELVSIAGTRRAAASGETMEVVRPAGLLRAPAPGGTPLAAAPRPRRRTGVVVAWAAFALLASVLLAVVFLLPGWVAQREPVAAPVPAASEPEEDPKETIRRLVAAKREADAVRAELDPRIAELRERAVARWGAETLAALEAAILAGDEAYARREYTAAGESWNAALEHVAALESRAGGVTADALEAGRAALAAEDSAAANEAFSLAAAVDPGSAEASRGLARAGTLDEVLAAMRRAREAEAGGRLTEARAAYQEAASLDADWRAAGEGVARMNAALGDARFVDAMSRGYAALEQGDHGAAKAAFESAQALKPGSSEPRDGLTQVAIAQRGDAVERHGAAARAAVAEERWADAVASWRQVLAAEGSVVAAQEGLARAAERKELDERFAALLVDPFRLTQPEVYEEAKGALAEAQAADAPRRRLDEQANALARHMALAATPVRVVLESDNATEVLLYRVGRLGTFDRRELELKPGRYTVVGSRQGYRDVREDFLVRPGQPMQAPVVVRSEEPI